MNPGLMGTRSAVGRVRPAIGAGLGGEPASWGCSEMAARAILPLKARQRAVYLGNVGYGWLEGLPPIGEPAPPIVFQTREPFDHAGPHARRAPHHRERRPAAWREHGRRPDAAPGVTGGK